MKNLLKAALLALCLISLAPTSWATAETSRFDGAFYSVGVRGGPISGVEATVEGNYIWGMVIMRSGDDPYFYGYNIDNAGNIKGSLYSYGGGTISGRVSGPVMVLTVSTPYGKATFVCLKASGNAASFLAGRYAWTYLYPPGLTTSGSGNGGYDYEIDLYFYSFGEVEVDVYDYTVKFDYYYYYSTYVYRKTGRNTATLNIPGLPAAFITFLEQYEGDVRAGGLSGPIYFGELSDD